MIPLHPIRLPAFCVQPKEIETISFKTAVPKQHYYSELSDQIQKKTGGKVSVKILNSVCFCLPLSTLGEKYPSNKCLSSPKILGSTCVYKKRRPVHVHSTLKTMHVSHELSFMILSCSNYHEIVIKF